MLVASGLVVLGTAVLAAPGYLESVRQAERLLAGPKVARSSVSAALAALQSGTSCRQPEIAADLQTRPPEIGDARVRLRSLESALRHPAQPARGVQAELRRLGGAAPYQREQPESPGDLLSGWIQAREAAIFGGCSGGWGQLLLLLLEWLAIAVVVAAAAVLAFRAVRARSRADADVEAGAAVRRRRTAAERFAAADGLAAAGDFAAALRELAGAVATELGGEAAWETSPLTVRELFVRAGRLSELRPLLSGFEEAVYGHRPVTRETYENASAVAAPYREPARRVA